MFLSEYDDYGVIAEYLDFPVDDEETMSIYSIYIVKHCMPGQNAPAKAIEREKNESF